MIKKSFFISFLLLILFFSFSHAERKKSIHPFFTRKDPVHSLLKALLSKAKKSVYIASYEISDPSILKVLLSLKTKGLDVKIVTDGENENQASLRKIMSLGIPIIFDDRKALMHHKFIIIDRQFIWTGSANLTRFDLTVNRNNILITSDPELVPFYENEFFLMFEEKDFRNQNSSDSKNIKTDNGFIQSYFTPRNDEIIKVVLNQINHASKKILIAAFALTHTQIINALQEKIRQGLDVQILIDRIQAKNKRSIFQRFDMNQVALYQGKGKLHHKFMIVDEKTVLTGSFNFTKRAALENNENLLLIHDSNIAKIYEEEWQRCRNQK